MTVRNKNKALAAMRSDRRGGRRRPGQWGDTPDPALASLARAWTATMIATLLLFAALALSRVWDGPLFLRALQQSLSHDPQLAQASDDFPRASPAGAAVSESR